MMLMVMFGFAALSVDIGRLYMADNELQVAADAAAMAGVSRLPNQTAVRQAANQFATLNGTGHSGLLQDSDIVSGNWDPDTRQFLAGVEPLNTVRVITRRAQANSNPMSLLFAPVFGVSTSDVTATAIAYRPPANGPGFRFLIDDEMFDTDLAPIINLANSLGTSADNLLKDNNGDYFIDIPGGHELTLPTGQVGDEALFELEVGFTWTAESSPSFMDLLLYRIPDGYYRGISDSDLDPLMHVEPVSNGTLHSSFVNPDYIHVSPLYKSDVSNTSPGVNAKGERRGLVAFKIIGVTADPPGSVLPSLIIETVSPLDVDLDQVTLGQGGASAPVQLVY